MLNVRFVLLSFPLELQHPPALFDAKANLSSEFKSRLFVFSSLKLILLDVAGVILNVPWALVFLYVFLTESIICGDILDKVTTRNIEVGIPL